MSNSFSRLGTNIRRRSPGSRWAAAIRRYGNQRGLVGLLVALFLFVLLIGERFVSSANLSSIGTQLPELGVLSLAMMVTLLHGGVNLSVIATANLCALTMAYLLTTRTPGASGSMQVVWMVVAVFLAVGLGR